MEKFSQFGIKEDLQVTIHDGRELNLKEALKGKVSLVIQYFSGCPNCAKDHYLFVEEILKKFPQEDLQVVMINVNEEDKGIEKMKEYADAFVKSETRWWFANTDVPAFNKWAQRNLLFVEFKRSTKPGIEVDHDMGIVLVGRDLVMLNKEDVASAGTAREGVSQEVADANKLAIQQQLFDSIEMALQGSWEDQAKFEKTKETKTHIYLAVTAGLLVAAISGYFVSKKMNAAA